MYKNDYELSKILDELLLNSENECVEFKAAKTGFDVDVLGKYFSALGNEANLKNKQYSWIVFGVDNKTHQLVNTNFYKDSNFNKLKKQIYDNTTDNIGFIEIYELLKDNKRVIMFQVPAASGIPINWKGFPEQLDNKVRYLLRKLKEENKIVNVGSDKLPKWIINEV